VIDRNRDLEDVALCIGVEPVVEKWRAFGWWSERVDGNDIGQLLDVFELARSVQDAPKAIVCRTTLGQGVPLIMERERNHFVRVDDHEWDAVARQLEASVWPRRASPPSRRLSRSSPRAGRSTSSRSSARSTART